MNMGNSGYLSHQRNFGAIGKLGRGLRSLLDDWKKHSRGKPDSWKVSNLHLGNGFGPHPVPLIFYFFFFFRTFWILFCAEFQHFRFHVFYKFTKISIWIGKKFKFHKFSFFFGHPWGKKNSLEISRNKSLNQDKNSQQDLQKNKPY